MAFAEHEFRNAKPMEDGAPTGDHLASAARQFANLPGRTKPPPEFVPPAPPFPDELDYLWAWFGDLYAGLPHNGMSYPTVSWESLRAWQQARDIGTIEPWEARALVQLGLLRANVMAEKAKVEKVPAAPEPQRARR